MENNRQIITQEQAQRGLQPPGSGEKFHQALNADKLSLNSDEEIKQALRKILVKLGIRAANWPVPEELAVLMEHIRDNYSGHTLQEIQLAFDMAIVGKLNVDANCYENFSCKFFSDIMYTYRDWAKNEYWEAESNRRPNQLALEYKVDRKKEIQELFEMMRADFKNGMLKPEYIMASVYDKMVEHGIWEALKMPIGTVEEVITWKKQIIIAHLLDAA